MYLLIYKMCTTYMFTPILYPFFCLETSNFGTLTNVARRRIFTKISAHARSQTLKTSITEHEFDQRIFILCLKWR